MKKVIKKETVKAGTLAKIKTLDGMDVLLETQYYVLLGQQD